MQVINLINFVQIVDLSVLNFIDYTDTYENKLFYNEYKSGQLNVPLTRENKNILVSFIINNILEKIEYGKTNIIINTCKPMLNWRQYYRHGAIRSYRYTLCDNSIYLDIIKLNQWLDSIFQHLTQLKLDNMKYNDILNTSKISDFTFYRDKIKTLSFENIDIWDIYSFIKFFLANNIVLTGSSILYNLIQDGNYEYEHAPNIPESIKDKFKNELILKEII